MDDVPPLSAIRADAEALLAAAAPALDVEVPSCPGWRVERLVGHLGRVYRWTAGWTAGGGPDTEEAPSVEPAPAGEAVVGWARAGLEEVLAALATVDPAATAATSWGPQPGRFWPRRMAIETALHRWDVEAAVAGPGDATPLGPELAVAGIDEMFDVLLPERAGDALPGDGEVLHLHATDAAGEWLVTLTPGRPKVEHGHAKGNVAARGPASDLLLFLWNRVPADRLQVFGDADLLARWTSSVRL